MYGHNLEFYGDEQTMHNSVHNIGKDTPKYEQLYHDEGEMNFGGVVEMLYKLTQGFRLKGRAGTGKSHLLKQFIARLDKSNKEYLIMCPTHKACRVLHDEAVTLHSRWAVMKNSGSDPFNHYDYVIIDEASMVVEGFWRQLLSIRRKNPKALFVISGDYDQLKPVCDRSDSFSYENSRCMWELCDGNMVELTHCRRNNEDGQKLFKLCKDVVNARSLYATTTLFASLSIVTG
jgi:tRNA A37 threonylcarbamoyladenosine biosynthesis protein TsaE